VRLVMNRSSVRFRQAALVKAQVSGSFRDCDLGFAHEGGKPMSRPTAPRPSEISVGIGPQRTRADIMGLLS
jgi:hypothetical protein